MDSIQRLFVIIFFLTVVLAGGVRAVPSGLWKFDETSGSTAFDSSSNGLNIVLSGSPAWAPGNSNGALQFDGSTYGQVNDSPALDGSDKLAISFWVMPTGLDGNARFIISKRAGVLQEQSYGLFFGAGNKLFVDLDYNSGTGGRFESKTAFQNGQWYHVLLVFDGSAHLSQRARLYINGSLDRDAALPVPSIPDHASSLYIGIANPGYGYRFKGLLDELSISKEIPTEEELASAHQGLWTLEKWTAMPYKDTAALAKDPAFYLTPGSKEVIRESGKELLSWYQSAGRLRGRIEVPASGRYVFWLSARTAADLYLSSDSSPYLKKRIAYMSPMAGTGDGIRSNELNLWDQFASQMSVPVQLEAGSKYYLEVISQVSVGDLPQVRVAWAPEGGTRSDIPTQAFSYYRISAEDFDDDSLPDSWESTKGLDPADNGAVDTARQGESGDFDGDGLSNREEYVLQTDPANPDTDGDGRSDFDEVKTYKSLPLVYDPPPETWVSTVPIDSYTESSDPWTMVDGGIVSGNFRGQIEWEFTVPEDGVWLLQLDTALVGKVRPAESVDVGVYIDGGNLGSHTIQYGGNHDGRLRIVSQRLLAGTHRLKLDIDNMLGYRRVKIHSLEVWQPSGVDGNGNGTPDWVETLLAEFDHPKPHALFSRISPYCLEGNARLAPQVKVNAAGVSEGADESHWWVNLPLYPSIVTPYRVDFPSGLVTDGEVTWEATNVLAGGEMPLREDDSLKLGAWSAAEGSAVISVGSPEPSIPSSLSGSVTADGSGASGAIKVAAAGSNYLKVVDSDHLDGTDRLTLSFRAKPDAGSLSGAARGILSKREAANSQVAYSVFVFTGGRLFVDLDTGAAVPLRIDSGYTMTTQWQAVSIVFDGTLDETDRLKIYVDDVLVHTASVPVASIRNQASPLYIGTLNAGFQSGGSAVSFGGLLDDVGIICNPSKDAEGVTLRFDFNDAYNLSRQSHFSGAIYQVSSDETVTHRFTEVKTYTVKAVHSDGSTGELSVPVRRAQLMSATTVMENTLRYWTVDGSKIDPGLVFEPGANLGMGSREELGGAFFRFRVYPKSGGKLGIAMRLWDDGPIAGIGKLNSLALSDALQSGPSRVHISEDFPGYYIVKAPLVLKGLPPGGKVVITIFKSGTMFLDGSKVLTLWVDDLERDVAYLEFLYQIGLPGGYCHYIDVYDAAGNHLGRR